jgi:hypothetical protein
MMRRVKAALVDAFTTILGLVILAAVLVSLGPMSLRCVLGKCECFPRTGFLHVLGGS